MFCIIFCEYMEINCYQCCIMDFDEGRWTHELTGFWAYPVPLGSLILQWVARCFLFYMNVAKLKNCFLYKLVYHRCEFWWDRTSQSLGQNILVPNQSLVVSLLCTVELEICSRQLSLIYVVLVFGLCVHSTHHMGSFMDQISDSGLMNDSLTV